MQAKLALYRGDYDEAVSSAKRGREQASDIGYDTFESYAIERLSIAYRRTGRTEDAAKLAEHNVEFRRELEERDNVAESLVTLAEARIDQAAYDEAADHLGEALDIARETGAGFFEARARRALGDLAVAEDRPEDARDHLEAAVEKFRDGGARPDAIDAITRLVEVCETLGDEEAAERWRETRTDLLAETDLEEDWVRRPTGSTTRTAE
jgi:tetratricopeptide (TPR) repeat protein